MKILRVVYIIIFISFLVISCGNGSGNGDESGDNNVGGKFDVTLDMTQDDNGMAEVTVFDETFERDNGKPVTENRTFIGVEGTATIKLMNDRISSAIVTVNGQVIFDASDFNQNVSYLEKEIIVLDGLNILDVLLRSKPGGKLSVQIIMEDICVPENPPIEVCDGMDNDCDGQTDEDLSRPTTCGVGECVGNTGTEICKNGNWDHDTCNPFEGAKDEECDGLDNDCDGLTDEAGDSLCDNGFYCDGQEICTGTGGCQDGSPPCPAGTTCNESSDTCPVVDCTDKDKDGYAVEGGSCGPVDCDDNDPNTYPGAQELCDGKDNNCNGIFHEVETDQDGDAYFPCEGDCDDTRANVYPGHDEECDGLDNDCDGQTDEDFIDLGDSCSVGTGECRRTGFKVCNGSGTGTTCNATAGSPSNEICDGKDNDCDGKIDEGICGPDLIIQSIQQNGNPYYAFDEIRVPIRVVVINQGASAADIFKTSTSYTYFFGTFGVAFTVSGQSDIWYPWTTSSLAAGAKVTFNGWLTFGSFMQGETVQIRAKADSCSGDEFMPAYCRVDESNEGNNESSSISLTLPYLVF